MTAAAGVAADPGVTGVQASASSVTPASSVSRARVTRAREIGRPLRLAHRGDWRRGPENSLAAFRAALAIPACDGLELDVRHSRDGVPIVIHDETLRRVQGRDARASELSASELEALGVPTLAAVLAEVPLRAFLDVELKEEPTDAVFEALAAVRGVRSAAGGTELQNAALSSFELSALRKIRAALPGWPCWLNADDLAPATVELAARQGCAGISADWRAIDERAMARAAAHGLAVAAWTVRRRATFERLARLGVVAICVEGAALS